MNMRALIVDDEDIARRHLIRLLEKHPDLDVVGQAQHGVEAVALIRKLAPDVVFLDIQMPGMDGFDVLREIDEPPLVVFTTAYDEYALAAFKENAIDYLLKPIGAEDLGRAVRKLRTLTNRTGLTQKTMEGLLKYLESARAPTSQILITVRDVLKPVRLDQIVYVEALEKYTLVRTVDEAYETDSSLAELEARLPASNFIRIHRSHIVNRRYIAALRRWGNRQLKVELTVSIPAELYVSRRCVDSVLQRMGSVV
jgi:two-component system LytT family response regulator